MADETKASAPSTSRYRVLRNILHHDGVKGSQPISLAPGQLVDFTDKQAGHLLRTKVLEPYKAPVEGDVVKVGK